MKKCYVLVENNGGVMTNVVVYNNYDDARIHFESCIDNSFAEINIEPGNEYMYARDNDDCDYEIAVWPTELV